jgi:hypothetical protein
MSAKISVRKELVKLEDETMLSLLAGALGVSETAFSLEGLSELALRPFCRLLAERPFDVLECVALPALGTGHHVLGLRVRDDLDIDAALCAQKGTIIGHH